MFCWENIILMGQIQMEIDTVFRENKNSKYDGRILNMFTYLTYLDIFFHIFDWVGEHMNGYNHLV